MSDEKSNLHPRNLHRQAYDFDDLIIEVPELKHYVFENKFGAKTINFSISKAVKLLNKALLQKFYHIKDWDIPDANLCPPIPGRADYVHYLADLLTENFGEIPKDKSVKLIDIGVGANMVYPIIASQFYRWQVLGTDINETSLENAKKILKVNPALSSLVQVKKQTNPNFIFKNIIQVDEKFTLTMCNPPFHKSEEEAIKANFRKTKNLNKTKTPKVNFNFGGQQSELWCDGGELAFVTTMITESKIFSQQVLWFTCLISKKEHLPKLLENLKQINAVNVKVIDMAQGQKVSRILAWTFISKSEGKSWSN
ncbi:23S rRNA (adenine(1618)-N(6))-methyltransferase RlmF [Chryseobacterium sp. TY3]